MFDDITLGSPDEAGDEGKESNKAKKSLPKTSS